MRVLHVVESLAPRAGRIEAHLQGLMTVLDSMGISAQCCGLNSSDDIDQRVAESDIIHVHGLGPLRKRVDASRLLRRPCVVSPHGQLIPHAWRRRDVLTRLRERFGRGRRRLAQAAVITASTLAEVDHLQTAGFSRVEHLPVGVPMGPPASSQQLNQSRCMLYLGPLDPIEGLVPLLKACEQVADDASAWRIVFCGHRSGDWLKMIRAAVERRDMTARVDFEVDPPRDIQQRLLRDSEIVIQPSLIGVAPLGALDALAHGTPALVSTACGLDEIQRAGCGWCCAPKRGAIAEALAEILGGTAQHHADMGSAGQAWVREHWTWDVIAPRYRDVYSRVAGK
jgi:glycosyltransferase involved in cell wall biosynthesis